MTKTIEVFADVRCPFTHVGLRRLVAHRVATDADVVLRVRSWPLELVNDGPLDAAMVAEEVGALRDQVASDLFTGFDVDRFPSTSMPALALAAAAYRRDMTLGERVSLDLRLAMFEDRTDIADEDVLARIASDAGLDGPPWDEAAVREDWHEGQERDVVGSPHFFVDGESWFCPSLDISHSSDGFHISFDRHGFEEFIARCCAP